MKKGNEKKYFIWLSSLKIKNSIKYKLIEKYKTLQVIYNLNIEELKNNKFLNQDDISKLIKKEDRCNIDRYIDYMNKNNIKLITYFDDEYPTKLKNIYDPPFVIYYKGNINLLNKKSVAIIGSRNCTNYGKVVAKHISSKISNNEIYIVSGLAKGIDTFAHIGAISKKAKTIAVLGHGLDIIYPYENLELAGLIIKKEGLIISEYIVRYKA